MSADRARRLLNRYTRILNGESIASFQIVKSIEVEEIPNSLGEMLELHDKLMEEFRERKSKELKFSEIEFKDISLLDLKLRIVEEYFKRCNFCERRCGVDRSKGELGFCRVKETRIASEFLHFGEEPELVPSHTIFFSGCNFNCVYCQNWDISQYPESGVVISPKELARVIERRFSQGSKNLNLVGGEPTPNLLYILKLLKELRVNIPVVWNSNMYMTKEVMEILEGLVDIYLTDFKYGNDECALRLSNVRNYFEVVSRNHLLAKQQAELLIRHLILPNHLECCTKVVIDWISENLGTNVYLNLMDQYRPEYKAMEYEEIRRFITEAEFREALQYAISKGFEEEMLL